MFVASLPVEVCVHGDESSAMTVVLSDVDRSDFHNKVMPCIANLLYIIFVAVTFEIKLVDVPSSKNLSDQLLAFESDRENQLV